MVSNHRLGEIGSTKALERQPGLRGLKTRYFLSASNNWIRRKHRTDRSQCLENPRPQGDTVSHFRGLPAHFHAEPIQFGDRTTLVTGEVRSQLAR